MESRAQFSLFSWSWRSHLRGSMLLGAGLGLMTMVMAPAYLATAKAVGGGLSTLAREAGPLATSFEFLTGPVQRLDTIGGYLSYKIYPNIALLVAIYGALQGTQVIRGSEARGLFDLWLVAGRTRRGIFFDRTLAFTLDLTAATVLLWGFTAIGGLLADEQLTPRALGQCAAVELTGLFAFALGILLSQFLATTRAAAGAVSAYLVAGFVIANLEQSLGMFRPLRYFTPFYYYIQNRTLVPGIGVDYAALAVLLGVALLGLAVSRRLLLRRDIGGVVIPSVRPARPPRYRFVPSRLWRRSLWLSWISEHGLGTCLWALGILTFAAVEAAAVPTVMQILRDNRSQLGALLQHLVTESQYLSAIVTITPLLLAAYVVTQVSAWHSDIAQGRTDAYLAQPVSLWRLILERATALLATSAFLSFAAVSGFALGSWIGNYGADWSGLLRTGADLLLFGLAVGGLGMLLLTISRGELAVAVTGAILVVMLFLSAITGLFSWPGWTNRISLFDAFGSPYLAWPAWGNSLYMAALAAAGFALSYVLLRQGMRGAG